MSKLKTHLNEAKKVKKLLFDCEAKATSNGKTVKITLPVFAISEDECEKSFLDKIELLRKNGHFPKDMKVFDIKVKKEK